MKPMSHVLRRKIAIAIKNRQDISNLIKDVSIKDENLDYAIIKSFNRTNDNFNNASFANAVIGEKGKITNISNNIMRNCNFGDTKFLGRVYMRRCDCRDSDFSGADCGSVEYQGTDFRGVKFCETLIRLGTSYGMGTKFSQDFFGDLAKSWNVEIKLKEE